MPKATANREVEAVVQTIIDALESGDEVRVTDLGVFDVVTREARPARKPQTGEASTVPPARRCGYLWEKAAKHQLNASGQGTPKKATV
jgi:DNA-binding protein HU-beta